MQRISWARKPNVVDRTSDIKQGHNVMKHKTSSRTCGFKEIIITVVLASLLVVALNVYEFQNVEEKSTNYTYTNLNVQKPTFSLFGKNVDGGYLRHVLVVLERLGFQRADIKDNWDVLWSHEYPFRTLYPVLRKLKSHQKVNHFPGSGYITNKLELSTSNLPHIPLAFKIPQDKEKLLNYVSNNTDKMFVQKDNNHRGITIKHINELDFTAKDTFVQEYVNNPLLIDGYKFDIGIYTVLTSIDPLRVYVYKGDVLFRFCPVKYHPFDPQVLDKYVVGDDYLPIWNVPSLKTFYQDLGLSMKNSFDTFLKTTGRDPNKVWNQVDEAIQKLYLLKEPKLIQSSSHYISSKNFFEMVRIDFVIDENLNVFLMEANMSPNLSSAHFPPNRLLYEQVIFNTLALVGIAQYPKKGYSSSTF